MRAFTLIELPAVRQRGFTLIELLVVVTIIVVLLALLTPALDKAVYQAQLVACGAQLKGIGSVVTTYALDNRRSYPHRPGVLARNEWQPVILLGYGHDDRTLLRKYLPTNTWLLDPLCAKVDLEDAAATNFVFAGYDLWFGFRYLGEQGMTRMGNRLSWGEKVFNLLASDYDIVQDGFFTVGSHPDSRGVMNNVPVQNTDAYSQWLGGPRGPVDMNYAYDDLSVLRLGGVAFSPADDARITRIPYTAGGGDPAQYLSLGTQVPNQ